MKNTILKSAVAFAILASSQVAWGKPYNPQALQAVIYKVNAAVAKGHQPIVLMDLDDTLINTRERNLRILREFALSAEIQDSFPEEANRILSLEVKDIKYQTADTLKALGISDEELLKKAGDFWIARFFSNEYCALDRANLGAAKYLHRLVRAGAKIVYLTGRDAPRMHDGTVESMKRNLFPLDESDAELMMKPDAKTDDLQFKVDAFAKIATMGDVVGVFENEPANINAMADAFSWATAVFLDTVHSAKPDVPFSFVQWVKNFRMN